MTLRSPDEVVTAGLDMMLEGQEPTNHTEQMLVMNFVAFQIAPEVAESACLLIAMLYPKRFGLLTESEVLQVVAFQNKAKAS